MIHKETLQGVATLDHFGPARSSTGNDAGNNLCLHFDLFVWCNQHLCCCIIICCNIQFFIRSIGGVPITLAKLQQKLLASICCIKGISSIWSHNHVIYTRLICPYFTCLILIKEQMTITIAVRYCWRSHAIVLRERAHRLFSLITFQIVFESSYKKYTVRAP